MRTTRTMAALLGTAVLVLCTTGCGSGDGERADANGSAAELTGPPVKVMAQQPVNTNLPAYPAGLEAAEIFAKDLNARGGIGGRPLEVITCDDRGDANEAANCARKAVREEVVAVVGSFSWDAGRAISILGASGIPWFGACCAVVEQEFKADNSYVSGSLFSFPAAQAWKAAQDGCKNPAAIQVDIAVKDLFFDQMRNGFKAGGLDPKRPKYISMPPEPQDYSSQAAQATSGTDCIVGSMSEDNWAAFLPAYRAAGGTQRLYGPQGQLNEKIAKQFPQETQNAVVVNSYPNIDSPVWKGFRDALDRYDAPEDLDWNSLVGLGTWASFTAFVGIAQDLETIDAASFTKALEKTDALDTGGMQPVLDFTKPYTGLGGAFPRIINRQVAFDVIKDGKPAPIDGEYHDMSAVMEGRAQ